MRVEIPAPAPWFTPNDRRHWAETNRLVQAWRGAAQTHARALSPMPFFTVPVVIKCTVHKDTRRSFDPANLMGGSIKAAIDGLVDAGVLAGDSPKHVCRTIVEPPGEVRKPAALVLEIEVAK